MSCDFFTGLFQSPIISTCNMTWNIQTYNSRHALNLAVFVLSSSFLHTVFICLLSSNFPFFPRRLLSSPNHHLHPFSFIFLSPPLPSYLSFISRYSSSSPVQPLPPVFHAFLSFPLPYLFFVPILPVVLYSVLTTCDVVLT